MGSLDLFKATRSAYISKEGFDIHGTSRHSVADPFRDQVKGAWFCLKNGLLSTAESKVPACYKLDGSGQADGEVPACFLDVHEKGLNKIRSTYKSKLYDAFPDLRYQILLSR